MFETVSYRYSLWKLERAKRRVQALYTKLHKEGVAEKRPQERIDERDREGQFELRCIDDEIYTLITQRLIRQAHRLLLPVSYRTESPDDWEEGQFGQRYMTVRALAQLRTAIRHERKERADQWLRWLPGLTGIIGTLIGLAALLLRAK